ncbi:hypothetical protein HpHUE2_14120 [Helicobacter pylori]
MGCGSGGGGESPVEIRVSNNGDFQIRSKADSVTIQGVKLNRGNCAVNFVSEETLGLVTPISIQDFKDMASVYEILGYGKKRADMQNKISQLEQKGLMMKPQALKFGESLKGISQGCDIIEAEIQTNKGTWTFNFNR